MPSKNAYLTLFDETKNLKDWSLDPRCEVKYGTLVYRFKKGIKTSEILKRNAYKVSKYQDQEKLKLELEDLYIKQRKTIEEIADIYHCHRNTIQEKLRKNGIIKPKTKKQRINKSFNYFLPNNGYRFNNTRLIFLKETGIIDNRIHMWLCKCDCGKEKIIRHTSILSGSTKSCGCLARELLSKTKYAGYQEISGTNWNKIIRSATKRNLEFTITIEYAWDLFLKQNRKCFISGEELYFNKKDCKEQTASLDRIDASKGYIEGNVQWTSKRVNMAKQAMCNDEFIELCHTISRYNNGN